MNKYFARSIIFLFVLFPLACSKTYTFNPINASTQPTATPTYSYYSPYTPTPTCNSAAVVSTYAGQTVIGSTNGTGSAALFNFPVGLAIDSAGNLYVADTNNNLIRKISPGAVVTTLAGQAGVSGYANGPGATALFDGPQGVAVDSAGNVYVADLGNNVIREITPGGVVLTLAGQKGVFGAANGTAASSSFYNPFDVAVDSAGNVYVADNINAVVRKISGGMVSTLAGQVQVYGSANGPGATASFYGLQGLAVDTVGNIYVADSLNQLIRKITPGGVVSTLAGQALVHGNANGLGPAATFYQPVGVTVDSSGNVYVGDFYNAEIREISPAGLVTTLAGSSTNAGWMDGSVCIATFFTPCGVAVDSTGDVYDVDSSDCIIRKISP